MISLIFGFLCSSYWSDTRSPKVRPCIEQVEQISKALGIVVEVEPSLQRKPVIVVPNDAQPLILLKGLAFALHATVAQYGTGLRLGRTKSDLNSLKAIDQRLMTEAIQGRLLLWDREIKEAMPLGSPAAQVAFYIHRDSLALSSRSTNPTNPITRGVPPEILSPAGKLLRRIVDRVGVENLSTIMTGEVRAYSSAASPMESQVMGADEMLEAFKSDQDKYASDPNLQVSEEDKRISHEGFVLPAPVSDLDGLKFVLTANRFLNTLNLTLDVFNRKGERVARSFVSTRQSRDNTVPSQRAIQSAKAFPASTISLSTEQVEFEKALIPPFTAPSEGSTLFQKILHPDSFDPAEFLIPTALDPWVKTAKSPVIAVISDDLVLAAHYSVQGQELNTSAFEALLQDSSEKVELDGIRILRPKDPLASEPYDCNRENLGRSLRSFVKAHEISLKSWSNLAFEQDSAMPFIPRQYLTMLRFFDLPTFRNPNTFDEIFQTLGCLSEATWSEIQNGAFVDMTNEDLRSRLWRCITHCDLGLSRARNLTSIFEIPQEMFPDGLPTNARLQVRLHNELALRPGDDHKHLGSADMSIKAWTDSVFVQVRSLFGKSPKIIALETGVLENQVRNYILIPCTRKVIEVRFEFAPQVDLTCEFYEPGTEVAKPGLFTSLPNEYRNAVYAEWTALESQRMLAPAGAGG